MLEKFVSIKFKKLMMTFMLAGAIGTMCSGAAFAMYDINAVVQRVKGEVDTFGRNLAAQTTRELQEYERTHAAQAEREVNAEVTRLCNERDARVQREQVDMNRRLSEYRAQVSAELRAEEQRLLGVDIGAFKDYVGKHFQIQCKHKQGLVIGFNDASKELCLVKAGDPRGVWTVDLSGHILSTQNPSWMIYTENTNLSTQPKIIDSKSVKNQALATWSLNPAGEIVSKSNPNTMLNIRWAIFKENQPIIMCGRQAPDKTNDKWSLVEVSTVGIGKF